VPGDFLQGASQEIHSPFSRRKGFRAVIRTPSRFAPQPGRSLAVLLHSVKALGAVAHLPSRARPARDFNKNVDEAARTHYSSTAALQ
jgi:hypothetical protein